jgi:hypothetical protein
MESSGCFWMIQLASWAMESFEGFWMFQLISSWKLLETSGWFNWLVHGNCWRPLDAFPDFFMAIHGHFGHFWNLRNLLGEEEVSMCLWLGSGWPPQMKVRDLRANNRGSLNLDWAWSYVHLVLFCFALSFHDMLGCFVHMYIWICLVLDVFFLRFIQLMRFEQGLHHVSRGWSWPAWVHMAISSGERSS